jgi:hypothetical protein
VTFDELVETYEYFEQVVGLMDGGSDICSKENVGERCKISGSIRFKNLRMTCDYMSSIAMDIAKKQVTDGAHVICHRYQRR